MDDKRVDEEIETLRQQVESMRPVYPELTLKTFFEESPPHSYAYLTDLEATGGPAKLILPDLDLHCSNENCSGRRLFGTKDSIYISNSWNYQIVEFVCRNCRVDTHRFALAILTSFRNSEGVFNRAAGFKLGQSPQFGPQTPSKLVSLIGPDRELFLQGRRAESQGLGIGAFAYYRRVVENQKNRIIAEIARVAKLMGSPPETLQVFEAAKNEVQFSKSVAMVKDLIPQTLMISGQNPLTLLHSALSKGLHDPAMNDAHCLELAKSIRVILADLSERASEALKDNLEIENALKVLRAVPPSLNTKVKVP